MWIFPLVGYAGVVLGFGFLTLAIGTLRFPFPQSRPGTKHSLTTTSQKQHRVLYYLSELVEEHTVLAKKLLTRLFYTIIAMQILLAIIDRLPIFISLLTIAGHAVYAGNLRHFPPKILDPSC